MTITRQSCLLQELTIRLQGFKIKCLSSVENTFSSSRSMASFFDERLDHSFSYVLTFQIMLSPKYFLLNKEILSAFLGLSTTVQFDFICGTSVPSRNRRNNIPSFQEIFCSCRGLCCGAKSLVCMTMQFSNMRMQMDSFTLSCFVQVYLKMYF